MSAPLWAGAAWVGVTHAREHQEGRAHAPRWLHVCLRRQRVKGGKNNLTQGFPDSPKPDATARARAADVSRTPAKAPAFAPRLVTDSARQRSPRSGSLLATLGLPRVGQGCQEQFHPKNDVTTRRPFSWSQAQVLPCGPTLALTVVHFGIVEAERDGICGSTRETTMRGGGSRPRRRKNGELF